jgi:two-component system response regulator FixJ
VSGEPPVFIVDDDPAVCDSLAVLLKASGFGVETFESATQFLASGGAARHGCLIADIRMPDMDGLALQEELARRGALLAVIIVTGHGDVPLAVRAMKAGAVDFLEKPFDEESLMFSVRRAAETISSAGNRIAALQDGRARLADLTKREREVLDLVVAGRANKVIAHELKHLAADGGAASRARHGQDECAHCRRSGKALAAGEWIGPRLIPAVSVNRPLRRT